MTHEEIGLLQLAHDYGDGLSLSGPRIGRRVKEVARGLIQSGCLSGKLGNLALTEAGKTALSIAPSPRNPDTQD